MAGRDHVSTRELRTGTGWQRLVAPLVAHWTSIVGIVAGLVALGGSIWVVLLAQAQSDETARTILLLGLAVAAVVLAALPWVLHVRRALAQARDDSSGRGRARRHGCAPARLGAAGQR